MAARALACTFVTPAEVELFARLAPECAPQLHAIGNGVDTEFFSPAADRASPYGADEEPIVFTGAMDYWPNVDAVTWFASEVMPRIVEARPRARFYIVGMNPVPAVSALAGPRVVVTGKVDDVRPYLQHARVAVAPLRVARGVQNKVLEGLAMARPTVVTPAALEGIAASPDDSLLMGEDAAALARAIIQVLDDPAGAAAIGRRGRTLMEQTYRWDDNMAVIERALAQPRQAQTAVAQEQTR
jgi:sugar transferase (PEP-CTERM/EpsH1 system associated)